MCVPVCVCMAACAHKHLCVTTGHLCRASEWVELPTLPSTPFGFPREPVFVTVNNHASWDLKSEAPSAAGVCWGGAKFLQCPVSASLSFFVHGMGHSPALSSAQHSPQELLLLTQGATRVRGAPQQRVSCHCSCEDVGRLWTLRPGGEGRLRGWSLSTCLYTCVAKECPCWAQ